MNTRRLETLLSRFAGLSVMVVGDFFLDKYLVLDPDLAEPSLETGLDAYQVVGRRCMPGAAGTVMANLHALGVGSLHALGFTGDDGEGYELRQGLSAMGVGLEGLFQSPDRFTPTYIKPMDRDHGGVRESNRIDIQNRSPMSRQLEERIIALLRERMPALDGLVVQDQVGPRNCGVITDRVREAIGELGAAHPDKVILVDSRERIGEFRHIMRKANRNEAFRAAQTLGTGEKGRDGLSTQKECPIPAGREELHPTTGREELPRTTSQESAERWGRVLYERGSSAKPVFVTLGAGGLLLIDEDGCRHVPGIHVPGPVDTVGAGDSVTAGIVSSLCAGADCAEAGLVGNLVASITVRQLGVTGTASPGQMLEGLKALS